MSEFNFHLTWLYSADIDPGRHNHEYGLKAYNVQRACSKLMRMLDDAGYVKSAVRIIDCQNMDIP